MPLWVKNAVPPPLPSETRLAPSAPAPSNSSSSSNDARTAKTPGHVPGVRRFIKRDLIPFTRQVAGMLSSGMTLVAALSALYEQAATPAYRAIVGDLLHGIESGAPFSEALARYPKVFDSLYVNMVRAGERSGEFAPTMLRLATMMEANARLKRKIRSAMTYPTVVMSMALVIATVIITCVVPVFGSMYGDFGAALPAPTQVLVLLSNFIRVNFLYVIGGLVVVIFALRQWVRTPSGKLIVHDRLLNTPVVGALIQKVAVARMTRLLAQMLRSGVPILEALELVAKATGNQVIENAILDARHAVEQGGTNTSGLEGKKCLPAIMVRMIGAGEKSGRIDEMLDNIATNYDDEVETMLASLTSLLEPVLMVFLGVVIGGIVIALFLPIFKMGEIVSRG
jgi:type IV pilus assembly protein PilC